MAFEEAGVAYVDVARLPEGEGGGVAALLAMMRSDTKPVRVFAPPIVKAGELVLFQTANILQVLAPELGLVPDDATSRIAAHQLQLTISDFLAEVHDTHHPIATSLYYEDQKAEAKKRTKHFIADRIPRFLSYFESVLGANGKAKGRYAIGTALTYVDLSLFQIVEGLRYALPRAFGRVEPRYPLLLALRDRVAARPRIKAYLASPRRVPWSEDDLFRNYPALDG